MFEMMVRVVFPFALHRDEVERVLGDHCPSLKVGCPRLDEEIETFRPLRIDQIGKDQSVFRVLGEQPV